MHALGSSLAIGFSLALSLALPACSHDLSKLTAGRNDVTQLHNPDSGTKIHLPAPEDAGSPDSGTTASPAACEPCDPITDAGMGLGLRSCCRGIASRECGLTVGEGTVCLAQMVPGQSDSACAGVRSPGGVQYDGCCRPDGRCGLQGDAFNLGCVARDEILPALGIDRVDAVACDYECSVDNDCAAAAQHFVCTEDPADSTRMHRICVNDCTHDLDCAKSQVCGLGNDVAMDRVLAFCQAPIGSGQAGDNCSSPRDCAQGVCLKFDKPTCSQLCTSNHDCPTSLPECGGASIASPKGDKMQTFGICQTK